MSKVLDLIHALAGNPTTKDATAQNTPALDDNTTKLATTAFLRNQFTGAGKQSIAGNGYQKFPGGLIIQWGTTSNITGGSFGDVTMPIPMPSAVLQVMVTPQAFVDSTTPIIGGWQLDAGGSKAKFRIRNTSTGTAQFSWLAIGY